MSGLGEACGKKARAAKIEESSTGCPPQLFFGSFQPCALKIQPLNHFFSRNLKIEKLKKGFKSVAPTTPSTLLKDKEEARIVS